MWRAIVLTFVAFAILGPLLLEVADAQQTDPFVAVVDQKTAEITGAVGSFREQLMSDHATIVAQNNKIADLTKQIEALKGAQPPAVSDTPVLPGHTHKTHPEIPEAPK